ncbi:hypothetical protein [Rossellomorea aquimaris]|uniref:Tetracyclin repressor-like C-terminal domain-containing protein n=1 Tax=Rossellomorea aquimaris TaxID=189382 RepID=A0A366EN97_9BACI|nr:hypothetical protein [Rossellomorea aquimaris]RBP03436.1 hypothetical protein DET59_109130 [Rossellomorea aquimaris]
MRTDGIDSGLKKLEEDYIRALNLNESSTIEEFIQTFLYDSWDYNEQNMEMIASVMGRYSRGEINQTTFGPSFDRMVNHLRGKLSKVDSQHDYPMIHSKMGASILVSLVDGLVIQYFAGVYSMDELRKLTPQLKRSVLNALSISDEEGY